MMLTQRNLVGLARRRVTPRVATLGVARRTALACMAAGAMLAGMSGAQAQLFPWLQAPAAPPAEVVPLPRPAPKARDAPRDTAATEAPRAPAALAGVPKPTGAPRIEAPLSIAAAAGPPVPVLPDPRNRAIDNSGAFTPEQRALATKVSAYLSSLQSLTGKFVQIAPNGSRSTGDFFIQKPGKVRFEYDPPSPIAIVADGSSVVVRDRKLATQDLFPLSQTPLRFLLSDRLDLMRDTNLVNVSSDEVFVSVAIEEKQPLVGTSRLLMMIGTRDFQLKQWTVTDPQGYDTTVAVYNLDSSRKLDPGLFRIDQTIYPGGSAN